MTAKCRVAVLFGGMSSEHDISLISANSIIQHIDKTLFDVVLVGIDRAGTWLLQDRESLTQTDSQALVLQNTDEKVPLSLSQDNATWVDVVFPMLHGAYGEDGCMQGFLETLQLPYVGASVLGSAIAMDKVVSKRLIEHAGISVTPFCECRLGEWQQQPQVVLSRISAVFKFPVFVKPASAGSSIGITKVKTEAELSDAIAEAFLYEEKIIVEQGIVGREIEVSVLEELDITLPPKTSLPGEIKPTHEFYDYDAKYFDPNGALLCIPAELTTAQVAEVRELAARVFQLLQCEGMARVDFFLEEGTGKFYFNEANTLPGFTKISMYPQLWQVSGVSYTELITHLIKLAIIRQQRKKLLQKNPVRAHS